MEIFFLSHLWGCSYLGDDQEKWREQTKKNKLKGKNFKYDSLKMLCISYYDHIIKKTESLCAWGINFVKNLRTWTSFDFIEEKVKKRSNLETIKCGVLSILFTFLKNFVIMLVWYIWLLCGVLLPSCPFLVWFMKYIILWLIN